MLYDLTQPHPPRCLTTAPRITHPSLLRMKPSIAALLLRTRPLLSPIRLPAVRSQRSYSLLPHRYSHHPSTLPAQQTRTMATTTTTPVFSSSYDPKQGVQDLAPLLAGSGGRWALIESGKGVERSFKFKTFKKTWVS